MCSGARTPGRQPQYFRCVALLPGSCNLETSVLPLMAQAHAAQPLQAGVVRQAGGTAGLSTQVDPVQGGTAAGLKIGLGPHYRPLLRDDEATG
jgi:hypothetical protein